MWKNCKKKKKSKHRGVPRVVYLIQLFNKNVLNIGGTKTHTTTYESRIAIKKLKTNEIYSWYRQKKLRFIYDPITPWTYLSTLWSDVGFFFKAHSFHNLWQKLLKTCKFHVYTKTVHSLSYRTSLTQTQKRPKNKKKKIKKKMREEEENLNLALMLGQCDLLRKLKELL